MSELAFHFVYRSKAIGFLRFAFPVLFYNSSDAAQSRYRGNFEKNLDYVERVGERDFPRARCRSCLVCGISHGYGLTAASGNGCSLLGFLFERGEEEQ